MTDRELLEAAAKAAGYKVRFSDGGTPAIDDGQFWVYWNPLTVNGDAFRLAAALGLVVDFSRPSAGEPFKQHAIYIDALCDTETLARRAIVMSVAAIGGAQ
jgi:hypothetical protein